MSGNGSSRDVAETSPTRPVWDDSDERNPASRPADGGGYGAAFARQVEKVADDLRTSDRPTQLGPGETTTGDASWWDRNHNGE